jgi:glutaminyl-peptide cyclotransferase
MRRVLPWAAVCLLAIVGMLVTLLHFTGTPTRTPAAPLSREPAPLRHIDVVAEYPHDPHALTQGLIYAGGVLYESTGGRGQSSLRKVDLTTGRVLQERAIDSCCVGEGLTEWHGQLLQLTPKRTDLHSMPSSFDDGLRAVFGRYLNNDNGVRYDLASLEPTSAFVGTVEGWGLTHDGHELIKSDGTSLLRFLNPETMKWQGQIAVVDNGKGIRWLNELEFVRGEVYANIWQEQRIAIIRPDSGQITGWIDLSELLPRLIPPPRDVENLGASGKAVANGIAYDAATHRLFVTGKNWPRLFEIRVRN